jgi:hypothetical protein
MESGDGATRLQGLNLLNQGRGLKQVFACLSLLPPATGRGVGSFAPHQNYLHKHHRCNAVFSSELEFSDVFCSKSEFITITIIPR